MITRRPVGRSREMRIAKTAAAATRCQPALAIGFKVKHQLAGCRVDDLGTDGNAHDSVVTFTSRSVATFSMQAAPGDVQWVVPQVQQSIHRLICDNPHIATGAAVSARRATARHKLLAPE